MRQRKKREGIPKKLAFNSVRFGFFPAEIGGSAFIGERPAPPGAIFIGFGSAISIGLSEEVPLAEVLADDLLEPFSSATSLVPET